MRILYSGLMATLLSGLAACNGKAVSTDAGEPVEVTETVVEGAAATQQDDAVLMDDGKHTPEYVAQRLKEMYDKHHYTPYEDNPVPRQTPNYDSLFCSEDYLRLYKKAEDISMLTGNIVMEADHWVMGQDIAPDWRYDIVRIDSIMPRETSAVVKIRNFGNVEVTLSLVFERGDWYVDNFLTSLADDEAPYDERKALLQFIDEEE